MNNKSNIQLINQLIKTCCLQVIQTLDEFVYLVVGYDGIPTESGWPVDHIPVGGILQLATNVQDLNE